jgi:phage recombination protein Bet
MVEYNEKNGKITKIARVKNTTSAGTRSKVEIDKEREEYNAKAAKEAETAAMKAKLAYDEELLAAAKKAEPSTVSREPCIDEKLKKSRFNQPSSEDPMVVMKERAVEAIRERVAQEKIIQAITVPATRFDKDQVNLIKATVARNCSNTEFELLMYLSAQYGLDPIRRQIWAVKYGDAPASIFTGRDGFLEIAHRSGVFDGMESGIKQEGDEIVGWAKVYRKDMVHAFYVEVYLKEYTTGKNLWISKPRIMIQKVAESSCLRRAFSVSGLYCPEEIPDAGGV